MMKIFLRCRKDVFSAGDLLFKSGKEYEFSSGRFCLSETGQWATVSGMVSFFDPIEYRREVFEAHGQTWKRHTPGEPMPCDAKALIHCYVKHGPGDDFSSDARVAEWFGWNNPEFKYSGWRYAQEQKPTESPKDGQEYIIDPRNLGGPWKSKPGSTVIFKFVIDEKINAVRATAAEPAKCTDNMGVSQPVIDEWKRREQEYTDSKNAEIGAKQQAEDAKALELQQAGEALSRDFTNQHEHRMGWR